MTKKELIDSLAAYRDDQYVCVLSHSERWPQGAMLGIQGVKPFKPWHNGKADGSTDLLGIMVHEQNAQLKNWIK